MNFPWWGWLIVAVGLVGAFLFGELAFDKPEWRAYRHWWWRHRREGGFEEMYNAPPVELGGKGCIYETGFHFDVECRHSECVRRNKGEIVQL